ncbi:MAG: hypothetical protein J6V15_01425 [Clostridia bacterium]|nr:hypothetical protein [Clostridia bacterium]
MLHSTLPQTPAQAAVIARSRQLTDFCWTPVRDVPSYLKAAGNIVLPAGVPIAGFPYASTEVTDKFFCENVSFESFVTAIANPDSKLYQPGQAAFYACNYGIVCNGLARYALGIRRRVSTARWYTVPGMDMVKPRGEYTFEDMRLCDVLYAHGEGRSHVALITDLLRDENGVIQKVEVSEAIRPHCVRRSFTWEQYSEKFALIGLWRYSRLDDVPPFDADTDELLHSGLDKVTPSITVDNGNHSNYLVSQQVIISTFIGGDDIIEVYRNGELIQSLPVCGRAVIPYAPSEGSYTLRLQKSGGCVEFCVCDARIRHKSENGLITVTVDGCTEGSGILYFDFRQAAAAGAKAASLEKYEELTDEEKRKGMWTRPIPQNGANFKVYFENKYGVWTLPMRSV